MSTTHIQKRYSVYRQVVDAAADMPEYIVLDLKSFYILLYELKRFESTSQYQFKKRVVQSPTEQLPIEFSLQSLQKGIHNDIMSFELLTPTNQDTELMKWKCLLLDEDLIYDYVKQFFSQNIKFQRIKGKFINREYVLIFRNVPVVIK